MDIKDFITHYTIENNTIIIFFEDDKVYKTNYSQDIEFLIKEEMKKQAKLIFS